MRGEVAAYLRRSGIPAAQVSDISAVEMTLAYKAMQWDLARGAGEYDAGHDLPRARPNPAAAQSSEVKTASRRFDQTLSIEDAIALLDAKR